MKSIIIGVMLLFTALAPPVADLTTRFKAPAGFTRVISPAGSFAAYLQALPLKPAGTPTKTYLGNIARTNPYTAAVVDMSIGTRDLQQCADALMRLRAEYFYQQKNYQAISFNFTSGFRCDYEHYAKGYRYSNNKWVKKAPADYSYPNFMRYLILVFSYAGTLSLQKELKPVANANDIKIGDVFIRGGSPGHCFIVIDMVENNSHKKQFLLAQSFIPAQNIQVLKGDGPWMTLGETPYIPYGDIVAARYLMRF
ncbi:DUF4846 domain-containing protein [Mucilaginibacter glaciei]|uniref:DUF4846 domain-containing protein n=1 Tax=Mucilaginibacter glaciei TaxID=2772109 RepID=A0A926NU83_9SPHI|nr:DUF4846 domain-containing protein [Mucilaginibacter glaciei]MBD1394095.1 DUF4846 domain-containing protein [Mucilaginibacter glaciei]